MKKIHTDRHIVSYRCGTEHWKWPDVPDICDYPPRDIIERIKSPEIVNSRGLMSAPEVEKFWHT